MNPNPRVDDIVEPWTHFQQRLWDSWAGAVPWDPFGIPGQPYNVPLEIWEEFVNLGLQTLSDCHRICVNGSLPNSDISRLTVQWAEQMETITARWTHAQKQLCDAWLRSVKNRDSKHRTGPGNSVFDAYQYAIWKTFETQTQWMACFGSFGSDSSQTASTKQEQKASDPKASQSNQARA